MQNDPFSSAYPALDSLLLTVAKTIGADRLYLVTPLEGSKCIVLSSAGEGALPRGHVYSQRDTDFLVDAYHDDTLLGRLIVSDPPPNLDHGQLEGFATAAGYILGHAYEQAAQSALMEKVLENFPGLLVVMEGPPELRIVTANSRFIQLLPEPYRSGTSPVGVAGANMSDPQNEQSKAMLDLISKVYKTGQSVSFEHYETDNPERGKTYWNWSAIPIGKPGSEDQRLVMLIAHEITESVQARRIIQTSAAEARARAEELDAVINHMADGVAIFDTEGRLIRINPAGTQLIGRHARPGSLPSKRSTLYGLYTPEGVKFEAEQLPSMRALSGETLLGVQMLVKRPKGEEVIISASASPLYDSVGQIMGSVVVFHDITQEKVLERLKDEFLSVVSHELRTPLTAIMGYSDLLLRGVHGTLSERHGKSIKAVRANAVRLLHLINDLLDVSKLESGAMELELEPVDLNQSIARTITRTRVLAVDAEVSVINRVAQHSLPRVRANDAKLQQVIENLLTNAIKFTPKGGSVVFDATLSPLPADEPAIMEPAKMAGDQSVTHEKKADLSPGAVEPGLATSDMHSVIVSVTDTGAGLEEDQMARIWDRFYQVDSTSKRRSGGAGLGLAIVRNLVELHSGQVWARSEGSNRGSAFIFSLPLAIEDVSPHSTQPEASDREDVHQPADHKSRPAIPEKLGTILLVEDHPDQREIICDMLESEGYGVVLAEDGEEALEIAATIHPLAIILDVLLPRADGWEVLHRLKSNPDIKDIPVLISSVVDQEGFGKRLGADDYLIKPLDEYKLRSSLRRLTGAAHTKRS